MPSTYAGNLANMQEVEGAPNYVFWRADICDAACKETLMAEFQVDGVIHFGAESHVDRFSRDPFARSNVMGTLSLLQAARTYW